MHSQNSPEESQVQVTIQPTRIWTRARRVAIESLMNITADSGMECFTTESHASRAFLETTNAITFNDEDMEVEHPDHRRPFYLMATINGVQIRRALVDTGASLNLIALSTLEAMGLVNKRILGVPMEITGFGASLKNRTNSGPDKVSCN